MSPDYYDKAPFKFTGTIERVHVAYVIPKYEPDPAGSAPQAMARHKPDVLMHLRQDVPARCSERQRLKLARGKRRTSRSGSLIGPMPPAAAGQ